MKAVIIDNIDIEEHLKFPECNENLSGEILEEENHRLGKKCLR